MHVRQGQTGHRAPPRCRRLLLLRSRQLRSATCVSLKTRAVSPEALHGPQSWVQTVARPLTGCKSPLVSTLAPCREPSSRRARPEIKMACERLTRERFSCVTSFNPKIPTRQCECWLHVV